MPLYLHLFHGRPTPAEQLDDWGYDGPMIGPFDSQQTTYGTWRLYREDGMEADVRYEGDLIVWKDGYYGDSSLTYRADEPHAVPLEVAADFWTIGPVRPIEAPPGGRQPSNFVITCPKGCIGIFQLESSVTVNADLIEVENDPSESADDRKVTCCDCGYEGTVAEFKAAEVERQADPTRAQYL